MTKQIEAFVDCSLCGDPVALAVAYDYDGANPYCSEECYETVREIERE